MIPSYIFTSESVSEGHPDKICDQISDAILDAYLELDSSSRVACEVMVSTNTVVVAGEVKSQAHIDIDAITRQVIRDIGYTKDNLGFHADSVNIMIQVDEQSPDIAQGVDGKGLYEGQGAGDQGTMFGFAVNETEEKMPLTISLSHKILRLLAEQRKQGKDFLLPDSKSQVSIEYEDGKPKRVHTVVVSSQHTPDIKYNALKEFIIEEVIRKTVPAQYLKDTRFLINPTGQFLIGGPKGDAGLTGRKIIVDTYGGWGRHGGGAFSGKDPSKVDRSAAYMCRYCAKNIVAADMADKCELQISYAIGYPKPISFFIETFGTNKVPVDYIQEKVNKYFSFNPVDLIAELDLLNAKKRKYRDTAVYGHFGRNPDKDATFSWESLNKVSLLKE